MFEADAKTAALIDEGLTAGEAEYLQSGGRNMSGLTPPAPDHDGDAPGAAPAARSEPSEPSFDSLQRELRAREDALAAERAQTQEHRERATRLDERLRIFQEAIEPDPAKPAAPPDPESDPIGYMRHLGEQVTGIKDTTTQVATSAQERAAEAELKETYLQDARQFVATRQPDWKDAYSWLMANRDAELAAAGYTDPAERMRIINLDERDIVARALMARQTNPNAAGPAQIIYGLAKARGFQAPAVRQAGAPAPTGMRQSASRSLSSAGGAPAPTSIDLAKIADMDDGEYLAWKSSLSPAQHKQLANLLGAPR